MKTFTKFGKMSATDFFAAFRDWIDCSISSLEKMVDEYLDTQEKFDYGLFKIKSKNEKDRRCPCAYGIEVNAVNVYLQPGSNSLVKLYYGQNRLFEIVESEEYSKTNILTE